MFYIMFFCSWATCGYFAGHFVTHVSGEPCGGLTGRTDAYFAKTNTAHQSGEIGCIRLTVTVT
jgi:hypothetical protein